MTGSTEKEEGPSLPVGLDAENGKILLTVWINPHPHLNASGRFSLWLMDSFR